MFLYRIKVERPSARKSVVGYVFDEATISAREVRSWSEDKLHVILSNAVMGPAARSLIDAELQRRATWRTPAGAAFWISSVALLVSIAALVLSAVQGLSSR